MAIVTTKDMAHAAGISVQHLGRLRKHEAMPGFIGRNRWDSEVVLKWLADKREDRVPADQTTTAQRNRLYRLQGDFQEARNEVFRGNLCQTDAAEAVYREHIARAIQAGDDVVAGYRTSEDQAKAREIWYAVRTAIAESIESVAAALRRGEHVVATRLQHGRRLGGRQQKDAAGESFPRAVED